MLASVEPRLSQISVQCEKISKDEANHSSTSNNQFINEGSLITKFHNFSKYFSMQGSIIVWYKCVADIRLGSGGRGIQCDSDNRKCYGTNKLLLVIKLG